MAEKLIPADTKLAAKRGFLRTTSQALATTIPTSAITGAALSSADPATVAWSVGAAVLSSVLAGAVSFLQITSSGIPEDYTPANVPNGDGRRRAEPEG